MSDLAVLLAERFGSKAVRPNLMTLVDDLVEASMNGLQADEGSDAEEVLALQCEQLRSEIQWRIDELGGGL